MGLSLDTLRERETIIRWDEADDWAALWTASITVRKHWESYGFSVVPMGTSGWAARVPKDRISYKPLKQAQNP